MKYILQKFKLKLSCFLVLAATSITITQAQNISVYPTTLDFNLSAGNSQVQRVAVTNVSNKEIFIEAELGDWLRDPMGNHQYFKPDTLDRSLGPYLTMDRNFTSIAPGETEDVQLTLSLPGEPELNEAMRWSMLFITGVEPKTDIEEENTGQVRTQIREVFRFGIHIYQTPPTLTKKSAEINDLFLNEEGLIQLEMKNTGEYMLQCKAHLELVHLESGKEIKTEKREFPVFPEGERKLLFEKPDGLENGEYAVMAVIDYDPNMPMEAVETTLKL
ncbi:hypothetical protein KI659_07795 [Litoribacter alkaliphilus]|uniref:Molecular chaperone n=1 Tax=Litoribacter ruber TaxID=702568 RepID=A0AAP2CHI8_9BACT|nr:hypothetical protein [Litoribacter alkaliphilus]MBS9523915.1 hypothetical protein [Litoribacter alkaliphilus]